MIEAAAAIAEGAKEVSVSIEECRITAIMVSEMRELMDAVLDEAADVAELTSEESEAGSTIGEIGKEETVVDRPSLEANSSYVHDGHMLETDELGRVYKTNGELISKVKADVGAEKAAAEVSENPELRGAVDSYFDELKDVSDCPETIPDRPFDVEDLKEVSPEENSKLREEFSDKKPTMKREWEARNGRLWPKYKEDVYITNSRGELVQIRKVGDDYDAHHIQPLSAGGKNEAANLTPIRADKHFDSRGIHSPEGACSKIQSMVKGGNL